MRARAEPEALGALQLHVAVLIAATLLHARQCRSAITALSHRSASVSHTVQRKHYDTLTGSMKDAMADAPSMSSAASSGTPSKSSSAASSGTPAAAVPPNAARYNWNADARSDAPSCNRRGGTNAAAPSRSSSAASASSTCAQWQQYSAVSARGCCLHSISGRPPAKRSEYCSEHWRLPTHCEAHGLAHKWFRLLWALPVGTCWPRKLARSIVRNGPGKRLQSSHTESTYIARHTVRIAQGCK
jgi:hypothetical protein